MRLEKIIIKNFGVFETKNEILIDGDFATIIGDNGTGKTTILQVIELLFSKKMRVKGIPLKLIPDRMLESTIEYFFDCKKFDEKLRIKLPVEEDNNIKIKIKFELDEDLNLLYPIFNIGNHENKRYSHYQKLPFDDLIELIYIRPNIDNDFFGWIKDEFENTNLLNEIAKEIDKLNDNVSKMEKIENFNRTLNNQISKIMKSNSFNASLEANIQLYSIGKALKIFPRKEDKRITTHGKGFEKILSIISNVWKTDNKKIKIVMIDELENNLFYAYQSKLVNYLKDILKGNFSQVIITTNSPNVVKIGPEFSITKLIIKEKARHFKFNENFQYDYYQKDLATAVFYEKILVVEGHSEKMFYEFLFKNNNQLKKIIDTSSIYVLNNQGVHSSQILLFLKAITNKVIVLSDNDVWNKKCYGLKKIWNLVGELKSEFKEAIDFDEENIKNNGEITQKIIKESEKNDIFIQSEIGDTFEDALFKEKIITKREMEKLKKSKLKNLSDLIFKISKNVDEKKINDSKYLFKWIKNIGNGDL